MLITKELDEPSESVTYWTDSTTVLSYIGNDQKRFHVFVANQVQKIRDSTDPRQWKYVSSKSNPADDASHGLKGKDFLDQHRWNKGPKFLSKPDI